MATIELSDDTLYTGAMPSTARLFGALSSGASEPTSFGKEAIVATAAAGLATVASSGSASDLTSGTLPLGRLHAWLADISSIASPSANDVIYFDGTDFVAGPATSLLSGALDTAVDEAEASADAAAASATAAASSASAASTSASNASTSASNASTSASNASTSASNAATSESNASTSATNAANSATTATAAAGFTHTYSTNTTMADPGSGGVRFNSLTLASITAAAIDDLSATGQDISARVTSWADSTNTADKGRLLFRKGSTFWIEFKVTGLTDNSGWTEVALDYVGHEGTLSDTDGLVSSFSPAGDEGAAGSGSGDVTAASSFGTDNLLVRSDGTGKGVQASGISISDTDFVTGMAGLTIEHTGNADLLLSASSGTYTGAISLQSGNLVLRNDAGDVYVDAKDTGSIYFRTTDAYTEQFTIANNGAATFAGNVSLPRVTGSNTDYAARFVNTTDAASFLEVARFEGDRATPNDGDSMQVGFYLSNDAGTQIEAARMTWTLSDVSAGTEDSALLWMLQTGGSPEYFLRLEPTTLSPASNNLIALGSTSVGWADLHLATGGVINWANGEVTLTETDANTLTLAGGTLVLPASGLQVGSSNPFSDSAGTLTLQNIDALDATTESTIEAAIDTLANLGSIQGVAFTFGAYASTLLNNANEAAFKAAVNLEANTDFYAPSGTDVAVADGGTGRSTGTTAYALIATGTTATGAQQTLAAGATTEILVGGGASALPVWTTAQGSGAPVRAISPTLTTPVLGAATGTSLATTSFLVAGHTTTIATVAGSGGAATPLVESHATDGTSALGAYRWSNDTAGPRVILSKSRGGIAAYTVVASGDVLGEIVWAGADGTDFEPGASIRAEVNATPGAGDMPAKIVFSTTSDGAEAVTDRVAIDSSGLSVGDVALTPHIVQNSQSAAYTLVLSDAQKQIYHPGSDNNARTFTIPANSSVAYPVGTCLTFINAINTVTIAITSDTLTLAGAGSTGSRTLAANGWATAVKVASTSWMISGVGLT